MIGLLFLSLLCSWTSPGGKFRKAKESTQTEETQQRRLTWHQWPRKRCVWWGLAPCMCTCATLFPVLNIKCFLYSILFGFWAPVVWGRKEGAEGFLTLEDQSPDPSKGVSWRKLGGRCKWSEKQSHQWGGRQADATHGEEGGGCLWGTWWYALRAPFELAEARKTTSPENSVPRAHSAYVPVYSLARGISLL